MREIRMSNLGPRSRKMGEKENEMQVESSLGKV